MGLNGKTSLGKLYRPLDQIGENTVLHLELYNSQDILLETFKSPHEKNDGLSLLFESINTRFDKNLEIPLGNRISQKQSIFKKINILLKALQRGSPQKKTIANSLCKPSQIVLQRKIKIDKAMLDRMTQYCELNKVSLNSFLGKIVFKSYSDVFGLTESRWMIPVNVRTKKHHQKTPSMYSSYFLLTYHSDFNLHEVRDEFRAHLKSGIHWVNYYLGLALSLLPSKTLYWLTERDFKKNTSDIAGSYSNMGYFDYQDNDLQNIYWVMYPTVRAQRPFGAVALQWNHALTLGLRLHASVTDAEEKLDLLIQVLNQNLEKMSQR